MSDKGFLIEDELNKLNIQLNIPPFASKSKQMPPADVTLTRKIASHRIHVERSINRIKNFKILKGTVPISICGHINQIWFVCAMLTNCMKILVKKDELPEE